MSTFIEKRDKPALKNFLYFGWRNFLSNNDVFFEEIQKGTDYIFEGNLEKYHCNRKVFPGGKVVVSVLMREEKSFSEKENFYKSHQIVLLFRVVYLS